MGKEGWGWQSRKNSAKLASRRSNSLVKLAQMVCRDKNHTREPLELSAITRSLSRVVGLAKTPKPLELEQFDVHVAGRCRRRNLFKQPNWMVFSLSLSFSISQSAKHLMSGHSISSYIMRSAASVGMGREARLYNKWL